MDMTSYPLWAGKKVGIRFEGEIRRNVLVSRVNLQLTMSLDEYSIPAVIIWNTMKDLRWEHRGEMVSKSDDYIILGKIFCSFYTVDSTWGLLSNQIVPFFCLSFAGQPRVRLFQIRATNNFVAMAEVAALTLANICLDVQIGICMFLHPSDILALRKVCRHKVFVAQIGDLLLWRLVNMFNLAQGNG